MIGSKRNSAALSRGSCLVVAMRENGELTMSQIAAELGVGQATLYRHLAAHRGQAEEQAAV